MAQRTPVALSGTDRWRSAAAVCRFELQVQRREPATYLYAIVFLLLTFAFVSSGTVELVQNRGTLPKLSPLAITLAIGGLTAFGQVITTMISASAMLRDRAWRTDQLVFTTPVSHRAWIAGRWSAAIVVMALVYSALALGVLLGALAPWVTRDVALVDVVSRALWPWMAFTVPTSVAIATLLMAAALRTQRVISVVGVALALVFLWQGCEAVAEHFSFGAGARVLPVRLLIVAVADPFGTVATQVVTANWTAAQRAQEFVPLWGLVGVSRATWLLIAAVVAFAMLRRTRAAIVSAPTEAAIVDHVTRADALAGFESSLRSRTLLLATFTMRWLWRDRGWRVIAALGALNVLAHAVSDSSAAHVGISSAAAHALAAVRLVEEHARLFFILLATIYAGEMLWRDVDQRSHELVHSAPISSRTLVVGRVLGIAFAELTLVGLLLVTVWSALAVRGMLASPITMLAVGALWLVLPFVQWTVLALAVHVTLRNKIAAHLTLITGWVVAVALDANGVTSAWVRFADPPALGVTLNIPWADALLRAAWWSTVSALLLALTVRNWRRVTSPR